MDKPLVSVVIATYNMARYLPLAVRSVLDQTHKNIEVLVVDDGSTDGTQKVMEPFLDDVRVRYCRQKNKGQAAAKNCGVRKSTGDYIAFLDADDTWVRDKLDLQMPLFARSKPVGVVYSAFTNMDEMGRLVEKPACKLYRGRITGPLLIFNFVGFGTSVVKRECFERLGLFDEDLKMGIDYDLWLRFSTHYEFDYIDRPLLHYRVWHGQMSRNWYSRYLNGIKIMENFLRNFPDIVDKCTTDEAWAYTYAGFGLCVRSSKGRRNEALHLYLRALRYKPGYVPAWRGIMATILGK